MEINSNKYKQNQKSLRAIVNEGQVTTKEVENEINTMEEIIYFDNKNREEGKNDIEKSE